MALPPLTTPLPPSGALRLVPPRPVPALMEVSLEASSLAAVLQSLVQEVNFVQATFVLIPLLR